MIKSLVSAIGKMLRNPLVFLPAFATVAIVFMLAFLFASFAIDLISNVVLLEMVPDVALNELPFKFAALHSTQLIGVAIFTLLAGILFTSLSYWYAFYVKGLLDNKNSIGRVCGSTIGALGKILAFILLVFIFALFAGVLVWLFAMIGQTVEILGQVLLALLALAAFYLYVKLIFTIPALAFEGGTVKQALQKSWQFSVKRFWQVLLFLIILSTINEFVVFAGGALAGLFLDETIALAVIGIFWGISLAFSGLATALYYAEKGIGKSA